MTWWEVPEISFLQVIDETAALGIQGRNANVSFKDIGPLGFLVPMQLPDHAFIESHVDASKFDTGWQFSDCGLSCPSAFLWKLRARQ
jgi:hypothetical protein